jgi:predicted DNA-binding protein (MmcQ/YjbR family)
MKTREEVIAFCKQLPEAVEDYPFRDPNWTIMRHGANKKWFAAVYQMGELFQVNVKCEPMKAEFWRSIYPSVLPGYHMNKRHWNTVVLDGSVPEQEIKMMLEDSFYLTKGTGKKQQ